MQPTVGWTVHFFTTDTSKHFNGQGNGPYPAIITQTFAGGSRGCNLKILPPFAAPYDEGSVPEMAPTREGEPAQSRWWASPAPAVGAEVTHLLPGESLPE